MYAEVRAGASVVTWSRFIAGREPVRGLGPYTFDRHAMEAAFAGPVNRDAPVRRIADVATLARATPPDHAAWLNAMTLAFDRDFLGSAAPSETTGVVREALAAFAERQDPMTAAAVRRWAADRNFAPAAIGGIATQARRLGDLAD